MSENRNLIFDKILKAKNKNFYWDKIFELRKFVDPEMINKCFSLINSKEDNFKIIGIDILSQLGSNRKKFINSLLNKIFMILESTENEKLIYSSLIAIGHNNNKLTQKQIKIFEKFSKSKSKEIRFALAFSLLSVENQLAISILTHLSRDRSPKVRDWAIFGLGTQIDIDNQQIREALFERCFDKDEQTKQEAINGLAKRNDKRVNDIIFQELKSENFGSLLFDTIISLENGKIFLPELERIYKKSKNDLTINKEWLEELEFCIKQL